MGREGQGKGKEGVRREERGMEYKERGLEVVKHRKRAKTGMFSVFEGGGDRVGAEHAHMRRVSCVWLEGDGAETRNTKMRHFGRVFRVS